MNAKLKSKTVTERNGEPRWVKATVTYKNIYNLGVGLPLALHLLRESFAIQLYFARYTTTPYRLEIQMWTTTSLQMLRRVISAYKWQNVHPASLKFELCNGSMAHTQATNILAFLIRDNKLSGPAILDVCHWLWNMAGFSYVQEAAFTSTQVLNSLKNIPGWTDAPVFGTKATPATKEKIKQPVQKLRRVIDHRR